MITLALMLADENNRKIFSEIAQELEKPLKDFAAKLSKDMKDVTNTLAETTKAGLSLYANDIDNFVDSVVELCDVLGNKGVAALTKFSNTASASASKSINVLVIHLETLRDKLKTVTKSISGVGFKTLGTSMSKVADNIKSHTTQAFSLSAAYNKVTESIAHAEKIGNLARLLDVNTESFSNWADVVTDSGGNIDQFASSVGNVQKYLNEKCISADAFDYLLAASKQMESMSTADAKALGARIGIDENTVMLLKQGSTGLQAMLEEQKKLGSVTQDDVDKIKAFNKMMNTLSHIFRTVALQISSAILPALTWFLNKVKGLIDFLAEHEEFTKGFFIGVATVLLGVLLPALWSTFAPILAMIAVVVLLGAVFGAIFWAISALIENAGAIFDWLVGVVSVAIEGIVNAFSWLVDAIGSSISTIIGFFTFWLDIVSAIVGAIFVLFTEGPLEAINYFKNAILGGLNALYDKLPNWAKKLFSGIKGIFNSDELKTEIQAVESKNPEKTALVKGADALKGAQNTSQLLASSGGKAAVSNNNQVSYRNDFKITSNDPQEVGRLVDEKMRAMSQETAEHFDNGVVS